MSLDKIDAAKKANLIDFAYSMFQPGVLQPPADPGIALAGYRLVYYLNATDIDTPEFYGYIAASTTAAGAYALVIRGTQTLQEWLLDFLAIAVPFSPAPDAGWVALGFLDIYQTFSFIDAAGASHSLADVVGNLTAQPGGITQFLVLGHSLGGALATLAAAELAIGNPSGIKDKVVIYTYGSPRVGLLDFAASFDGAVPSSFRIWNILDIVPQFPTFPYIHVSGFGDSIVQTQQQLEELVFSPPCEHHLTSYQWLLDGADFNLDADCVQATASASVSAMAATSGHVPAQQTRSAQVMSKALTGHV